MFVLHSFMGPGVRLLGQEQFLAFYLSSAVFTSLASYVYKVKWVYPHF
jgi:membrane associated rhomboid family serine protease